MKFYFFYVKNFIDKNKDYNYEKLSLNIFIPVNI